MLVPYSVEYEETDEPAEYQQEHSEETIGLGTAQQEIIIRALYGYNTSSNGNYRCNQGGGVASDVCIYPKDKSKGWTEGRGTRLCRPVLGIAVLLDSLGQRFFELGRFLCG